MQTDNNSGRSERRLVRPYPRIIGGVCAALADYFGLNLSLVRITTLLLIFLGGMSLWVYIVLWIVIPSAPKQARIASNNENNGKI